MKSVKNLLGAAASALVVGAIACAPALADTDYTWSIDLDCTECHAAQAATLEAPEDDEEEAGDDDAEAQEEKSEEAQETAGAAQAKPGEAVEMTGHEGYIASHVAFGLDCVACHEDSEKLASAHKKMNSGKEATRLKKTEVSDEMCQTCHKLEDLAEETEDCEYITDDNGLCVNPHALPEASEHGTITCMSCHQVHETEKSLAQTAKITCTSCHHAGVFECGTCH